MGSGNYSYELNGQNINIIFIKFGICTTLFGINIFFFPPESVQKLLQEIDPFLSQHLAICDVGDLMFCHRYGGHSKSLRTEFSVLLWKLFWVNVCAYSLYYFLILFYFSFVPHDMSDIPQITNYNRWLSKL